MKIVDGDVEAWLERISWSTLKGWLDYMAEEPIGEERDDLRIGALASVFLNTKIDRNELGGFLHPKSYITGWAEDDLVYVLELKSPELQDHEETQKSKIGSTKGTLSDPVTWDNFTAALAHGKEIQRS